MVFALARLHRGNRHSRECNQHHLQSRHIQHYRNIDFSLNEALILRNISRQIGTGIFLLGVAGVLDVAAGIGYGVQMLASYDAGFTAGIGLYLGTVGNKARSIVHTSGSSRGILNFHGST